MHDVNRYLLHPRVTKGQTKKSSRGFRRVTAKDEVRGSKKDAGARKSPAQAPEVMSSGHD